MPFQNRKSGGQVVPQAPQFFGSLRRSMHFPPQLVSPGSQQMPLLQWVGIVIGGENTPVKTVREGHTEPQRPQFFPSA
jgi:hypothetical protein